MPGWRALWAARWARRTRVFDVFTSAQRRCRIDPHTAPNPTPKDALGACPAALTPLLIAADAHPCPYLWASAQGLVAEDARGASTLDAVWSQDAHAAAWDALAAPVHLRRGLLARRIDDAIVVARAPEGRQSLAGLGHSGLCSPLAARTLLAALALGRNIVWTGPRAACDTAMTSLAGQGRRPGISVTASDPAPVPDGFVAVTSAQMAWQCGIDRIIAPASLPADAFALLAAHTSAQAWMSGGRLERTLMRLESTCGVGAAEAAVALLAAVDLVVVVEGETSPHITQIAELTLVETGYRPALLFAAGLAIAPEALVPVGAPSFLAALHISQDASLADDLRHATREGASPKAATQAPVAAAPPPAAARPRAPVHRPGPLAVSARPRPKAPRAQDAGPDSQPGWELDRLLQTQPDADVAGDTGGLGEMNNAADAAEAASLAAQFGLGPPPPPRPRPSWPSDFSQVLQRAADPQPDQPTTQDIVLPLDEPHAQGRDVASFDPQDDGQKGLDPNAFKRR